MGFLAQRRLVLFVLIALLFISTPIPTFAEVTTAQSDFCPTWRLDQSGGSMAGMPTRDQGELGICYAVVASQLYDAWRKLNPNINDIAFGSTTSPLYAAVNYALEDDPKRPDKPNLNCPKPQDNKFKFATLMEGGRPCETFDALFKKGACSEDSVQKIFAATPNPTKDELKTKLAAAKKVFEMDQTSFKRLKTKTHSYKPETYKRLIKNFEESLQRSKKDIAEMEASLDSPLSASTAMVRSLYNDQLILELCQKPKPSIEACTSAEPSAEQKNATHIKNQIKALAIETLSNFKDQLDQKGCDKGTKVRFGEGKCAPTCENLKEEPNELPGLALAMIRNQISNPKNMPVAIGICTAALLPDGVIEAWKTIDKIQPPANNAWIGNKKCGPHSALIIGQQRNSATNKCQFVIRNSWGPRCGGSCNNAQCTCEAGTGNILMDIDYALANTFNFSMISETKDCK